MDSHHQSLLALDGLRHLLPGTRSGLCARPQVGAIPNPDDSEDSSSKEKPRVATASKPKRKHDDSEDDSDDDDPPPSKKCKCGRRSHEKSSYLCSNCVSDDSRRHASQRNALEDTNYNEDDVNDGSEFDESKVDDG